MSPEEKINYRVIPGKAEMWSDKDGISWLVFADESDIEEADIKIISDFAVLDDPSGIKFLALVDIRNISMISHSARNLASSNQTAKISQAIAIVASSPATKLIANFFIRFHRPLVPTKIFTSPQEAKAWLLTFPKRI
jgi:hypothetical protein